MALTLERYVIESTFGYFRGCGQGRNECIVYWTGPRGIPGVVDGVVLPSHHAGTDWYETDPAWITGFFLTLRQDGRTVRAQAHTHPKTAGHSPTDDRYPLVSKLGFCSLVVPRYGTGLVGLDDAYLTVIASDGAWVERNTHTEIVEIA